MLRGVPGRQIFRRADHAYAYTIIDSPVGKLKLVAANEGLAVILWENDNPRRVRLTPLVEQPETRS